jgi:heterodisulfide reductase subunit A
MVEVMHHPKVQVIANADILKVEGYVGNFKVKVRQNPRYVIAGNCTGCGECKDACPIDYPNEWEINLGVRKAISIPFDQAVPLIYSINRDYCIASNAWMPVAHVKPSTLTKSQKKLNWKLEQS